MKYRTCIHIGYGVRFLSAIAVQMLPVLPFWCKCFSTNTTFNRAQQNRVYNCRNDFLQPGWGTFNLRPIHCLFGW